MVFPSRPTDSRTVRALAALVSGVLLLAGAVVMAPAASADPVDPEVSINGGTPLVPDVNCSTSTPPADNNYCLGVDGLLILNDVDIDSIRASNVNLTIYLIGVSVVRGVSNDAVSVFNGNLVFSGTGTPRIELGTAGTTAIAINMAPMATPGSLTVGTSTSTVTVRVIAGQAPASPPATVEAGNTYELPGGPGPGPGPGPAEPGTLSVGGVKLVDEGELTGNTIPGVTVELFEIPPVVSFWTVTFAKEASDPTTYGAVEMAGGEAFFFSAPRTVTIGANAAGYSFDADGEQVGILFAGSDAGDAAFQLAGGIRTDDSVNLDGSVSVRVGSLAQRSPKGVEVGFKLAAYDSGAVGQALIEIFTTAVGITGTSPGTQVSAESNGVIRVNASSIALSGVSEGQLAVSNGGTLDLSFGDEMGVNYGVSIVWPEAPIGCIDVEAPMLEPERVPATDAGDFGSDPDKRFTLVKGGGVYTLTSTAPRLVNLSWEQGSDAREPIVGGQVCVLATRGMGQVDQGVYFSFSIEEGSEVTIQLLPEFENQFIAGRFVVAGPPVEPGSVGAAVDDSTVSVDPIVDNTAEYTFTMPGRNLTLSTVFDPVANPPADTSDSDVVADADIDADPQTINGNALLEVADVPEPDNAADFVEQAGDRRIAAYLEVNVEQRIQQGSTAGVWTEEITNLDEPVTVSLQLSDDLAVFTDYVVLHDDGETVTPIPATLDRATGELTFETDGFSTFAIAHGPRAALSSTGAHSNQLWALVWLAGILLVSGAAMSLGHQRFGSVR